MKHTKTELGRQSFKEHSSAVNARQRSAFIMIDGVKDDATILKLMAGMGLTVDDIGHLESLGLIEIVAGAEPAATHAGLASNTAASLADSATHTMTEQALYQRAYPIAIKLASGLGLRGFRLNLSVEGAASYKDLMAIAPKIKDAVGDGKFAELARALKGL